MKSYQTKLLTTAAVLLAVMLAGCILSGYLLSVGLILQRETQARVNYLTSVSGLIRSELSQAKSSLQMNGDSGNWEQDAAAVARAVSTYEKMEALRGTQTRLRTQMSNQKRLEAQYIRIGQYLISQQHISLLPEQDLKLLKTGEALDSTYRTILLAQKELSPQVLTEGFFAVRFRDFDLIGVVDVAGRLKERNPELYLARGEALAVAPDRELGERLVSTLSGEFFFGARDHYRACSIRDNSFTYYYPISISYLEKELLGPLLLSVLFSLLLFAGYFLILRKKIALLFSPVKELHQALSSRYFPHNKDKVREFTKSRRNEPMIYTSLFRLFLSIMFPVICMLVLVFVQFYSSVQKQSVDAYLRTLQQISRSREEELVSVLYCAREIAFTSELQAILVDNKLDEESTEAKMTHYLQRALSQQKVVRIRLTASDGKTALYDSSPSTLLSMPQDLAYFQSSAAYWDLAAKENGMPTLTFRISDIHTQAKRLPYLSTIGFIQLGLENFTEPLENGASFTDSYTFCLYEDGVDGPVPVNPESEILRRVMQTHPQSGSSVLSDGLSRNLAAVFPMEDLPFTAAYEIPLDNVLLNPFSFLFMIFLLAAVLLTTFFADYFHRRLLRPLKLLEDCVQDRAGTGASGLLPEHYEIYELGRAFEEMMDRGEQLQDAVHQKEISFLQLERKQQETEKIALQQQTEPHFTCNILLSVDMMIRGGQTAEAEKTIRMLGKYLRNTLGTFQSSTLREEFTHVETYLEMQKIRFGDRLEYAFSLEDSVADMEIPRFLIQPLVENSLVHGMRGTVPLCVELEARRDGQDILLRVTDNGKGMPEKKLAGVRAQLARESRGTHIGLHNVQDRAQLRWGKTCGLVVSSTPDRGTAIELRIPFGPEKEGS